MPLRCRDCNHLVSDNESPTAVCPQCHSIYLVPVEFDNNKYAADSLKRLKITSNWKKLGLFSYAVIGLFMWWLVYIFYHCYMTDHSCVGLAKLGVGILKVIAGFTR